VLSYLQCTLLVNTCTASTPAAYAAGNFLLHYWPSVRAVSLVPIEKNQPLTFDSATLAIMFVLVFDPTNVYGCVNLTRWNFMLAGGLAGIVVEFGVKTLRTW
jgi:hypothetical protein